VVEISAQNNGKPASTIPASYLLDAEGHTYHAISGEIFREILYPGIGKHAYVAFDVPRNGQYSLVVSGDDGKQARIRLAVSTTVEQSTPEGSTPEQARLTEEQIQKLTKKRQYNEGTIVAVSGILEATSFPQRREIFCHFTAERRLLNEDQIGVLLGIMPNVGDLHSEKQIQALYAQLLQSKPLTQPEELTRQRLLRVLSERIASFDREVDQCKELVTSGFAPIPDDYLRQLMSQARQAIADIDRAIAEPTSGNLKAVFAPEQPATPANSTGCTDPVVTYKPPAPDAGSGPRYIVQLSAMVNEDGHLSNIVSMPLAQGLPGSSTNGSGGRGQLMRGMELANQYNRSARENLAQWRLKPAVCDGKPVQRQMTFDFSFGRAQ